VAEFKMPSLGADMDAGTLVEWLVHEGDTVHRGDPIAVVDTDKSAIEVESFDDGVVETFLVAPGTRVAVGTPLARLAPLGAAAVPATATPVPEPVAAPAPQPAAKRRAERPHRAPAPPLRHHAAELGIDLKTVVGTGPDGAVTREDVDRAAQERQATARVPATPPVTGAPATRGGRRASPYARRLARELGVDLTRVAATGRGGTVQADDVLAARERTTEEVPPAPAAEVAPPPVPPAEPTPAAHPAATHDTRATIAALMSRAKREIPHYYVATTVDLRELTEWLHRTNRERPVSERIVPAAAILKATALAARRHPELNGFWVLDEFHPADDVHLGVAVRVRDGALVAPAIHDTADLTLPELMAALRDLVKRARSGRLKRAELADPTLTVTDLGDQGVEEVIGIIYPPQVALLGVGRITEHPWAVDGMLTVHPTVRLTLSGDHRATDGATGAQFLNSIGQLLQHPEEL
jgi:pyruvate dehydrogenase E2 component (dihydrolipoamide acetyltransferase)